MCVVVVNMDYNVQAHVENVLGEICFNKKVRNLFEIISLKKCTIDCETGNTLKTGNQAKLMEFDFGQNSQGQVS